MNMAGQMEMPSILFAEEEEMAKRVAKAKEIRAYGSGLEYLLDDTHENSKLLVDLMILEGLGEEFIKDFLKDDTDLSYLLSLDFLHCAALIMGEEYVRKNLAGKTISIKDAAAQVRQAYHDQQLEPYREMYSNLDERLKAARDGEEALSHQIEILKLQSTHAQDMFDASMEKIKMQYECEKKLALVKSEAEKEREKERCAVLKKELSALRKYASDLEAKNDELARAGEGNPKGPKNGSWLSRLPVIGRKRKKAREEYMAQKRERLDFTLSVLGDKDFSEEQIKVLMPILENESVPLNALKKLCQPTLPLENMKTFVKFIEGGKAVESRK